MHQSKTLRKFVAPLALMLGTLSTAPAMASAAALMMLQQNQARETQNRAAAAAASALTVAPIDAGQGLGFMTGKVLDRDIFERVTNAKATVTIPAAVRMPLVNEYVLVRPSHEHPIAMGCFLVPNTDALIKLRRVLKCMEASNHEPIANLQSLDEMVQAFTRNPQARATTIAINEHTSSFMLYYTMPQPSTPWKVGQMIGQAFAHGYLDAKLSATKK